MCMWQQIHDNKDLELFMNHINSFHDSCIKEIRYFSGAYVDADLSMYPINDRRLLNVVIQRQSLCNSMIEMEFWGLKYLKLCPTDADFTCEIHDSTMLFDKGCIYWCDCGGLSKVTLNNYNGTIICAMGLRWRPIDNCMGQGEFFLAKA